MGVVLLALAVWGILASTYFIFEFTRHPSVAQAQEAPKVIPPTSHVDLQPVVIELRHVAEIISASNNTPIVVIGFVAVALIFAWTMIRVTESHNRRHSYAPPRYDTAHEIEHAPQRPREISKGNLPVVRR